MAVNPIPPDYAGVTSYLIVRGAASAIDFYQRAFGAAEIFRLPMGERIGHAELRVGVVSSCSPTKCSRWVTRVRKRWAARRSA